MDNDYSKINSAKKRAQEFAYDSSTKETDWSLYALELGSELLKYTLEGNLPCLIELVYSYIDDDIYLSEEQYNRVLPLVIQETNNGKIDVEVYSKFIKMHSENVRISKINTKKSKIKWIAVFLLLLDISYLLLSSVKLEYLAVIIMIVLIIFCRKKYKQETDYTKKV